MSVLRLVSLVGDVCASRRSICDLDFEDNVAGLMGGLTGGLNLPGME